MDGESDVGDNNSGDINMIIHHKDIKKEEIGEKRRRFLHSGVGTPDYLAPEILLGIGHSIFSRIFFLI